jgi:hypothetical protein
LIFMPDVDWNTFAERTIIDSYWRQTVFFWSEEHAKEYRLKNKQPNGVYLTLEQCAFMTPITQGALFAFKWNNLSIAWRLSCLFQQTFLHANKERENKHQETRHWIYHCFCGNSGD